MGSISLIPSARTPAERILSRFDRDQLAGFIEVAIGLLDLADGNPDDEDGDNDVADEERHADVAWSEWHTRGRRKLSPNGDEQAGRVCNMLPIDEDAEQDDEPEQDDNAGCCAGDDNVANWAGGKGKLSRGSNHDNADSEPDENPHDRTRDFNDNDYRR